MRGLCGRLCAKANCCVHNDGTAEEEPIDWVHVAPTPAIYASIRNKEEEEADSRKSDDLEDDRTSEYEDLSLGHVAGRRRGSFVHWGETSVVGGSSPIPLPPPQPQPLQPGAWRDAPQKPTPTKPDTFVENGTAVPSALASAFSKDKKPFTYFKDGPPDLSTTHRPSEVRRAESQTPTKHLGLPKVLPIAHDEGMQHRQYNTPLPLYSANAAQEALGHQGGGGAQVNNIENSPTYKLLHGEEQQNNSSSMRFRQEASAIAATNFQQYSTSASWEMEGRRATSEFDRRSRSRTPLKHYFDEMEALPNAQHHHHHHHPNHQSRTFKTLQFMTNEGTGDVLEDTGVTPMVGHRRSRSMNAEFGEETDGEEFGEDRFLGIGRHDRNPSPSFHQVQRATGDFSFLPQQPHEARRSEVYSPGVPAEMDPGLAAKLAAAERPNVPNRSEPLWAGERQSAASAARQMGHMRAAQDEADWRAGGLHSAQSAHQTDYQHRHYATGAEVEADWVRGGGGAGPLGFNDAPKHYPTGSEVIPDWRDASLDRHHRSRSQGLDVDDAPKHFAAGAEVEAEWRDRSLSKSRSGVATAFDDRPKHYAAGAEVEADWRASGGQGRLEFTPKHYAAGAEVEADWAKRAASKTQRWESWGGKGTRTYAAGQDVRAEWEDRSASKAAKWDQQYSAHHGTTHNEALFTPNNPAQPPPPRPAPSLNVNVEVDRGGVLYQQAGAQSPRYRSRSQEPQGGRRSQSRQQQFEERQDRSYHLRQANAPNWKSVRGGRDGPAPVLTLHKNYDYHGHRPDVKDQGTYFGPTFDSRGRRGVSVGAERFGAAPAPFHGPQPGSREYWDQMGALDFHQRSQSRGSFTSREAQEASERQASEWRREMEANRVEEQRRAALLRQEKQSTMAREVKREERSSHHEHERHSEERQSRTQTKHMASEVRREAAWKAAALQRQAEEESRRQAQLRETRSRSAALEAEEVERRQRVERITREQQDSSLSANQAELERKKRLEAAHREQQRLDEEWRLAERERQKRQMGTDFLFLSQRGQPRDISTQRTHAASNRYSMRSASSHASLNTSSRNVAKEERKEVAREDPSWTRLAESKASKFASSGDVSSRSRATTPGSIYALEGGATKVEYDGERMRTITRDSSATRTFASNQVRSHVSPPRSVISRPSVSPRPVSAAGSNYHTSSYNKTVSSLTSSQLEENARRQREAMEADLRNRQYQSSMNQSNTTTTYGGSGPVVTSYTVTDDKGAVSNWQNAAGATTKASTSGDYLDPSGNKVSYVKEMFTSSDPGKEFSMLTQEEKKIMEKPVEPGVISRHVTTKYYKKSTYTSSSTTSTTPTMPAIAHSTNLGNSATTRVVRSPAPVY